MFANFANTINKLTWIDFVERIQQSLHHFDGFILALVDHKNKKKHKTLLTHYTEQRNFIIIRY